MAYLKSRYKNTPVGSGTNTPTMEKTDSVLNLTQPSLYGIFNTSSTSLNKENEEVEEYIDGTELRINAKELHKGSVKQPVVTTPHTKSSPLQSAVLLFGRLVAVGAAAFVYNEVTKHIHAIHSDGHGARINAYLMQFIDGWKPFQRVSAGYESADKILALVLEGLLLSMILPVLDNMMPSAWTKRLLSSSPNPYHRSNLANDVVRSTIAFLGISYAIRHIEWKSSLQMAMAWSLINPALWLLMDGTVNGFVASAGAAFVGTGLVYLSNGSKFEDHDTMLSIFLFVASFFFCGVTIFGKLGRILFGKKA